MKKILVPNIFGQNCVHACVRAHRVFSLIRIFRISQLFLTIL